jgi:hypothetical protein
MPTKNNTYRTRSAAGSSKSYGAYGKSGAWGANRSSSSRSTSSNWFGSNFNSDDNFSNRSKTSWWSSTGSATSVRLWQTNSPKFSGVRDECQWRMSSYRNVYEQCSGAGRTYGFSPTAVNRWMKFINQGCPVYKFSNRDFCKFFGNEWTSGSASAAFKFLKSEFGTGVKAVARGKGNCWLVAARSTVSGKPFVNYDWK